MSGRLFLVQFDERYLNNLPAEKQNSLDKKDLCCYTCGELFQRGQWFISLSTNKVHGKKRHVRCAMRINFVTKQDVDKLRQFKNVIYSFLIAGWLMAMSQFSIINGG